MVEVEEVEVVEVEAVEADWVVAAGPEVEMLARWMGTTWLTGALLSGG